MKYSVTELELLSIVECLKEFKGMLWGQRIKVYTDHKNLVQDALGLSSDCVYHWRLLLEEFGPNIVYIKGIDNTVADAISCLDYNPNKNIKDLNSHQQLGNMVKLLTHYIEEYGGKWTQSSDSQVLCLTHSVEDKMSILDIFANISKEEEIFPLTVSKIAREQRIHWSTKVYFSQGNTTRRKKTKKMDKRISLK